MSAALATPAPRRPPRRVPAGTPLGPAQIRWLGALLIAALLPQTPYVPAWVAGTGAMLVGLRFVLLARDRSRGGVAPARIPAWALGVFAIAAALVIRQTFGYFLGRESCVAFLFLLVGIKFLEARITRDGALLVCLASFLVVTPFFYGQSMFAAVAALPALLMLGATLIVLTMPPQSAPALSAWGMPVALAFRMFAQGIPLAALLFVLFPRLGAPLWGLPIDHVGKSGLSERMSPGAISELSLSDSVAFRVDFDGAPPPPRARYWRGPVLSRFDGREWSVVAQPIDGSLARPNRSADGGRASPISYTVTLEPHWRQWLFALDMPASLPHHAAEDADGDARNRPLAALARDLMLLTSAPVTQPLRYRQTSLLRATHPYTAGEETSAMDLELPGGARAHNPRTLAFAEALRNAHADDEDYIRAVLAHFRDEHFVYTLAPGVVFDSDPVDGFMFQSRRGFCEHYASAFVVMLRAAGIPARVVTGYQGGEINPNGRYMIVRNSDAHAWAEALIGGEWRRFDPTAAVAPSRIEVGLGGSLPAGEPVPLLARLDNGWVKRLRLSWDALNHDWRRNVIGFNRDRQRSLWRDWNIDRFAGWQIVAGAAALALAWVGVMLAWLAWKRRHSDRARALWERLCARLARAGLPRQPYEGPLSYVERAASRWPEYAPAFSVIGEAYASLRYGPAATRGDDDRERSVALAHLARAVDILPAPAALRAL
jgi:transglutaminase-like putative cysteine protease